MFSETNKQQQMINNESKQQNNNKEISSYTLIHWSDEAQTLWDKRE